MAGLFWARLECQDRSCEWTAGRGSLIWLQVISMVHITLFERVESNDLQLKLTGVCVCLQPGSGRWASVQTCMERRNKVKRCRRHDGRVKASMKTKGSLWTYLSRKSLSTTAEMSSRGFPIPKSVFSLCRDKSRLFHSDSHSSSLRNDHSLVFGPIGSGQCCFELRAIVLDTDHELEHLRSTC